MSRVISNLKIPKGILIGDRVQGLTLNPKL